VIRENSSSSRIIAIANAATLQNVTQKQSTKKESFNQNDQSNQKSKSKNNNHHSIKRENEKCICEEEHSFKKCSYIVSFNRKKE
jgi:protein required for attachment to host cells